MEKTPVENPVDRYNGFLKGKRFLVTGGGGYLGNRLVLELIRCGSSVTALDIRGPTDEWLPADMTQAYKEKCSFKTGDIRNKELVASAVRGVDAVFHLVSYGMSGREQLAKERVEAVNVGGTKNVINACIECGVSALVYTSTTNVVFSGNALPNKDESQPYLPLEKHIDAYSRSKALAEQAILAANGSKLKTKAKGGQEELVTCAIRPAGIYGEGEERHLPRIVSLMKAGMFCFTIGSPDSKVEFIYVDNLVHAHILAAIKLLQKDTNIGGNPYFVSDGEPINNFEFFRPLLEGLGYRFPTIRFPVGLMYYCAFFIEIIHSLVGRFYNFQPLMTRAEIFKVGVTHYFKPDKARDELGYSPLIPMKTGMQRVVQYYQEKRNNQRQSGSFPYTLFAVLLVAVIVGIFINNGLSY